MAGRQNNLAITIAHKKQTKKQKRLISPTFLKEIQYSVKESGESPQTMYTKQPN